MPKSIKRPGGRTFVGTVHINRLRRLLTHTVGHKPWYQKQCRVCSARWLEDQPEVHVKFCPVHRITCEAITSGLIQMPIPGTIA